MGTKIKKDIEPCDSKGNLHGYQERYDKDTNKILIRCFSKHGFFYGYIENHSWISTRYYIK